MRNNYEVRAQKFIQQIAPYLDGLDEHEDREMAVACFNDTYHRKVIYAHGMTRYALITSDYVVKVDYKKTHWGNCEDEMFMYKLAERAGYAYLFAKISRYRFNGMNFYIMPRINGIGKTWCDAEEYLTEEECDWVYDHVRDLHNENYGWKNGRIVIVDYAAQW